MLLLARSLLAAALACLLAGPLPGAGVPVVSAGVPAPVVYLAGELPDDGLVALGAAVAARPGAVLLLDSTPRADALRHYLAAARPARIVPVGTFPDGAAEIQRRLGVKVEPPVPWQPEIPLDLLPGRTAVVCPTTSRRLLLYAAWLAGVEGAPLCLLADRPSAEKALLAALAEHKVRHVYLVGSATALAGSLKGLEVVRLPAESDVRTRCRRKLEAGGPVRQGVVCNPEDGRRGRASLSALAPWQAARRRAALLLTEAAGKDVEEVASKSGFRQLDTLLLLADLRSIPVEQRPNPIPDDKDKAIDMEPCTPRGRAPFSYAVGRLFHADRTLVPLVLARQELLARATGPRRAVVASNPGGGLSLLETFSRNTAQELANAGYETTGLFGRELRAPTLRKHLPEADIFLWEGHHNTLIKDWGFATWDEPLPPSLVFLQSCLALQEEKTSPLFNRGAVAVLGTSTRTYSGSGGAFSLAFFNSLVYEGHSTGEAVRSAKNFLLAYARLKEKRLGADARRTGANVRAAWAFTLWGDPALHLPAPPLPDDHRPGVRHEVAGRTITLHLPEKAHDRVKTHKYQVKMLPNERLAGLIRKVEGEAEAPLVPLVFAEVALPRARPGRVPTLRTRLPAENWVFNYDERRRVGYLLVLPRTRDGRELRFHVEWQTPPLTPNPSSPVVGEGSTTPAGLSGR